MKTDWPEVARRKVQWSDLPGIILAVLLVCASFLPRASVAQVSEISFHPGLSGSYITDFVNIDTTSTFPEPDVIWERLERSHHTGDVFSGFTQKYIWMGVTLRNEGPSGRIMLEVDNPQINYVQLFLRQKGDITWSDSGLTGRLTPFNTRPVPHVNVVFPILLEQGEEVDVMLMLDKRRSSISYPLRIWSETDFSAAQQRQYAYYGLYFGIFGIIVFITLIAFALTIQRIYFWYFSYVLAVGFFVFVDIGLAHQYVYPESMKAGSHMRMAMSYLLVFTFNMFTMAYFQTRLLYRHAHKAFWVLCSVVIAIAIIQILFTAQVQANVSIILTLLYATVLMSIGLAIALSLYHLRRDKQTALIFLAAFSFIFIAGTMFVLSEYGLITSPRFLFTPIQTASILEIMLLSIGLAWQVRRVERDRVEMTDRLRRLENEKLKAHIQGIEKERNRIAADLHDAIGSKLGQIRRNVQSANVGPPQLEHDLKTLVDDVRDISHKLSPPGLSLTGLTHNIERLVLETDLTSDIKYTFQTLDIGDDLPEEVSTNLYRIVQEGISNIEKHSKASEADIQLIGHVDEIVLTIADNGMGMDFPADVRTGIGLDNIHKRVEAMRGSLVVTSRPGAGTEIMITIPVEAKN